jgi:hypothetical protein
LSDGTNISVIPRDPDVSLGGRDVILGVTTSKQASSSDVTNPFAPRMPGRGMR